MSTKIPYRILHLSLHPVLDSIIAHYSYTVRKSFGVVVKNALLPPPLRATFRINPPIPHHRRSLSDHFPISEDPA